MHFNKYLWSKEVAQFSKLNFANIFGKIGKESYIPIIWADYQSIAHKTFSSERTVRRHVKKLAKLGYFLVIPFFGKSGRRKMLIAKSPTDSISNALKRAIISIKKLGKSYRNIADSIKKFLDLSTIEPAILADSTGQNGRLPGPCLIIENKKENYPGPPPDFPPKISPKISSEKKHLDRVNKKHNLRWKKSEISELSKEISKYNPQILDFFVRKIERLVRSGYHAKAIRSLTLTDARNYVSEYGDPGALKPAGNIAKTPDLPRLKKVIVSADDEIDQASEERAYEEFIKKIMEAKKQKKTLVPAFDELGRIRKGIFDIAAIESAKNL